MKIGPYYYPDALTDDEIRQEIKFLFREMSDGYRSDSGINVHGSIWESFCDRLQENLANADDVICTAIESPADSPIVRFGVSAALFPNMWAFDFINQHEYVQATMSVYAATIMMHNLKKFELSANQEELFFSTFRKSMQILYQIDDMTFRMLFESFGENMFPMFEVANGDRQKITNVMFGILIDNICDKFSLSYTLKEKQAILQPFAFCIDTAFNWEKEIAQHYQYKKTSQSATIPPLETRYYPEVDTTSKRYNDLLENSSTLHSSQVRNIKKQENKSIFWGSFRLGCYVAGAITIIWFIIKLLSQ